MRRMQESGLCLKGRELMNKHNRDRDRVSIVLAILGCSLVISGGISLHYHMTTVYQRTRAYEAQDVNVVEEVIDVTDSN